MDGSNRMVIVGVLIVIIIGASTFVMFLGPLSILNDWNTITTTTTTEVDDEPPIEMIYVKDAILSCFTGSGYSLYENGTSTLETTLLVLRLIDFMNLTDADEFAEQFELINSSIASMHSNSGGFRPIPHSSVDIKTTTICVEILQILGEFNDYYYERTYNYLSQYFLGSDYDSIFDDGVWAINYLGLKCAYLLGNLHIVGVKTISIEDNVYPANYTGYRQEPALIEGEIRYDGSYFWIQNLRTRMQMIEALSWTVENPEETSYLLSQLVRTTQVISELNSSYSPTSALFSGTSSYSWQEYNIFRLCNQLNVLDNGDWDTKLTETIRQIVDPVHGRMKKDTFLSVVSSYLRLGQLIWLFVE